MLNTEVVTDLRLTWKQHIDCIKGNMSQSAALLYKSGGMLQL